MLLTVSHHNPEPLYDQITSQIRRKIIAGELQPGDSLPSIRQLAGELTISVITTKRAYQELEREGLIVTRLGLGTFVARVNIDQLQAAKRRLIEAQLARVIHEARNLALTDDDLRLAFRNTMDGRDGTADG